MSQSQAFFLCGPTASGKSALALLWAQQNDAEIVNADAIQLYRGLEILSAAPSTAERATIPHHLYGVIDPSESMDAGRYLRLAQPVIEDIQRRGKTPLIVGGSGLYLKFLTHGPSPLPQADTALRAALADVPLEELVARLRKIDPIEGARVNPHNRRYVERALEIHYLTGQAPSELRDGWESRTRERSAGLRGWCLRIPRADLHQRIAHRTRAMLEGGARDEVEALAETSSTCAKAIGIREIRDWLSGHCDRATCEERINAATRQYAKRQETWFRRETWLQPWPPPGLEAGLMTLPAARLAGA